MPKKSKASDVLTKDDLNKVLGKYFGESKKETDSQFKRFKIEITDEFDTKLNFRLSMQKDEILREVKEIVTENNSAIFTRIDPLLSELEDRRLDRELGTEKLRELDGRVTKLERS